MLRKLGFFMFVLGLALPAWSADRPGTLSGYVRNAAGAPQMGAVVEILGSAAPAVTAFTDDRGFFSVGGLLPGVYDIKVSAASFLPSFRDGVGLRPGGKVVLSLTLNTLFDAIKLAPAQGPADQDDWKWVLRSSANRAILRAVEDKSTTTSSAAVLGDSAKNNHDLKGSLSFLAGAASEGFGGASDMSTGFSVERSIFASDTIGFWGNIGYTDGASPASVLRASFSHKMSNGSEPQFALTMRTLPAPFTMPNASLQALAMTTSDSFALGDVLEFRFGSELQTIQFLGRVTAFRPFGSADLHLSPNTVVEYRYATSEPDAQMERGFESAPADLSESQPRVSMVNYNSALEHAHHHELSLSRRVGNNTSLQVAAFYDRVVDPALTGVGELSTDGGMVLPDVYSGTFTYEGNDLKTEGVRVVVQQKLTRDITGTMDVDYGGVLTLENPGTSLANAQQWIGTRERHSAAGKVSGVMPKTRTHWIASYRWIDGPALTPVDTFNASPGQAAPYLNIYFRQPVPLIFPGHLEALVDLRNLLAEGYVPVLGADRRTVYLVQSARAVRGGLNFTF
ncbi:MAG TPA: carboxypeptidase-like regulatory domain-containing protein [Terriglobales bacterium]|nr:carboxypeptidase-like regulatory domain-containing protein [Terriglobales bacterium]